MTAIEFAMVAPIFLLLLAGIFKYSFILWAQQNLDTMVQRAVRDLLTGSFQTNNAGVKNTTTLLSNLRTVMCGSGTSAPATVFTCNNVKLNVSTSNSFAAGGYANAYNSSTKSISSSFESYTCATPKQIVIVTAAVTIPSFFDSLIPSPNVMSDGSYLLQSRAVFRAEPFTTSSSTCS